MLDAGPQCFNKPSHILITHTHGDHVACLPFTLIRDDEEDHQFQIYAHPKAGKFIGGYIKAMFSMNAMAYINTEDSDWYNFNGLEGGDVFRFTTNKTDLEVEVFECDHAIPTISYGISEIKQKLKEKYLGLPGRDIGQLRRDGVEITKEVIQKRLAYVCDTSINAFDMNPTILDYDVIFIECTFFMEDELENARKTKHIHWDHLKPIVEANPDKLFVLFHFSQRYRDAEITEFFQREVDAGVTNIKWWVCESEEKSDPN